MGERRRREHRKKLSRLMGLFRAEEEKLNTEGAEVHRGHGELIANCAVYGFPQVHLSYAP